MRFCLELELEKNKFPNDYRRVILSYIKKSLDEMLDGIYKDKYFKDIVQKDFSFKVFLGSKPKFNKEEIILEDNKIKIFFTTDDRERTSTLLQLCFSRQKNIKFSIPCSNSMTLKNIRKIKDEKITNKKVIFKVHDLCIREHDKNTNRDKYYVFNNEKFNEQFKLVIKNQALKAGFSEDIANDVKFTPINCKKVLVRHYNSFVDVTVGSFLLEGKPSLLQYLYNVGLGSRNSCFGMLDIVTQDL